MTVNLDKEPDYDVLLQALIEKTKAGKLRWEETADEDTFVAAVKGQRTFEVTRKEAPSLSTRTDLKQGAFSFAQGKLALLRAYVIVRNEEGKVLFEIPASEGAMELFLLARRVALNVDEKIDSTMELLGQL